MRAIQRLGTVLMYIVAVCSVVQGDEPFQPWEKQGRILEPGVAGPKSTDLVSAPCVIKLANGRLRLYFWASGGGYHSIFAAEADPLRPADWQLISHEQLLLPATSGNISDRGPAFPFVVPRDDRPWLMFYCAWGSWAPPGELSNRTGLAQSHDGGLTWERLEEPLLALGPPGSFDAGLTGSVCVIREAEEAEPYRMYYTAGERYVKFGDALRGIVHVGYCTSPDGVAWRRHDRPLLSPRLDSVIPYEAVVSKPSVIKLDGVYHMWLSVFCMEGRGYRLGYARSNDGVHWERAFDKEIMRLTPEGFDSVNQSYPNVIEMGDELWMYYVGDRFGSTGIGWAKLRKSDLK